MLRDRTVALALTQPARDDAPGSASGKERHGETREEKRQVEALYLAQIAIARRLIFIENQYFSSRTICDALCERLREAGGPEVVLILPYGCEGALQAMALDTQRDVLLDRLREADGEQRLGIYWPTLRSGRYESAQEDAVYVHAKTMVVDDALLRIGSANLANRSMGLDGELDACVWVEGDDPNEAADARPGDEEAVRDAILRYRRRLMAYLLHVSPEEVADAEERSGSPLAAIEALREGERTLHPFEHRASTFQGFSLPIELADPAAPLSADDVLRATEIAESSRDLGDKLEAAQNVTIGPLRRRAPAVVGGGVIVALAAAWAFTPLRDQIDTEAVRSALATLRASPLGNVAVVLVFWVVAALGFPVTLLIATVAGVFGATTSVLISGLGVVGSASIDFAAGRLLPGDVPEERFGGRLQPIADRVRNRGVLTLAVLRNVPIAPFAIVNVACGLTPISYASFIAGTVLGMGPGIVVASVFGQELAAWLLEPSLASLLRLAVAAALLVGIAVGMDRLLSRRAGMQEVAGDRGRTGGSDE